MATDNTIPYVTKQDFKEFKQELNEDIKMHMGVLYERFSGEVKFVAEQVGTVLEKQQETNEKIDKLTSRADQTDLKFVHLETKFDHLEEKVDMLIETVGEIKVDVTEIKDELQNKLDVTDYQKLEKRVSGLEATL